MRSRKANPYNPELDTPCDSPREVGGANDGAAEGPNEVTGAKAGVEGIWEEEDYEELPPPQEDEDQYLFLGIMGSFVLGMALAIALPYPGRMVSMVALGALIVGFCFALFSPFLNRFSITVVASATTGLLGTMMGGLVESYCKVFIPILIAEWLGKR